MEIAVKLIIAYLLSHADPVKSEARQYIKDKLSGWKEKLALAVFDAAWDIAIAAVGARTASLTPEQADIFADAIVQSDKEMVA